MKSNKGAAANKSELRRRAEEQFRLRRATSAPHGEHLPAETLALVHELQVHQIELELQNEELRIAGAMLEQSLVNYTDLYDFAPVGYLTLGMNGAIRQVNQTGTLLLGVERPHLVGMHLASLVADESLPTFSTFLAKVCAGQGKECCDLVLRSQGAAPITVEITGTAAKGGGDIRIVLMDVSARKALERSQRELQKQLELQEQLEQTRKLEAIATLAGGIAHDFNNILAGIQGTLSLMEMDASPVGNLRSDIHDMTTLANRGANIAKQLLGFARLGKYNAIALDLARAARKTSAIFGLTHTNITIGIDFPPDLPAVLMDRSQFNQVLLNLMVNAAQAMPDGGQIRLRAESVELTREDVAAHGVAPGRFVKLLVADTGAGMDAATQAKIFEPFFTTKSFGQGLGLGLASAYGILKSHAGFITVDSALGKGSTFALFLPVTDRPIAAAKSATQALPCGAETILLVDDEEMVRKVCARLLERIGYKVLTASGGQQAVEIVREKGRDIALVILDMVMPGMNGHQTYTALQEIAPGLKVLLCSGYSLDGQTQEILDRGRSGFLQKPFDIETLSAEVRKILVQGPS